MHTDTKDWARAFSAAIVTGKGDEKNRQRRPGGKRLHAYQIIDFLARRVNHFQKDRFGREA